MELGQISEDGSQYKFTLAYFEDDGEPEDAVDEDLEDEDDTEQDPLQVLCINAKEST